MNEPELDQFENDLKKLEPARAPQELISRIAAAQRSGCLLSPPSHQSRSWLDRWWLMGRWLLPAAAGLAVLVLLLRDWPGAAPRSQGHGIKVAAIPPFKADAVEIDQELIAVFDTVAQLPSGVPVRFRCREWTDEVVLRDSAQGVVIERRIPRLEVVPVGIETY